MIDKFNISIENLKEGLHNYSFEVNDAFLKDFENSIAENVHAKVDLRLEKSSNLIQLFFNIKGHFVLTCDRSLATFDYPVSIEEKIIFKYGDEFLELSEDMYSIPYGTQQINVAQHIYEFITLALPMKRIHPDIVLSDTDDDVVIYSSSTTSEHSDEPSDPRWETLKKLRKK